MKKSLLSVITLALVASGASAAIPVTESGEIGFSGMRFVKSPLQSVAKAPAGEANTWIEDFESRPDDLSWGGMEWLPAGWQDVSKAGTVAPASKNQGWNLTWQVATNETISMHAPATSVTAYDGYAFAYIMSDVAYGTHTDLVTQDEWLITPASTPTGDDWLYFKLNYRPGWVVYNRDANDFTGLNNSLQIYASTDNGTTWTKIWDLVDDEIRKNLTEADLSADLSSFSGQYYPIYVNIKKYLNKSTKFAFRYYGRLGQPMALDNIAVGVPKPVANYEVPAGFFYEAATPAFEYPKNPKLLIPQESEALWVNTSTDILTNKWSYSDASGATVTSDDRDLVTPKYSFGQVVDTPVLTGYFESRASEPYTLKHTAMQAGGFLMGDDGKTFKGETTVGTYDILNSTVMKAAYGIYTFNSELTESWEKRLGLEPGAINIHGIGVVFDKPAQPYGFDFAEIGCYVKETVAADAKLEMTVLAYDDNGAASRIIGRAELYGRDMPKAGNSALMLRFTFPTPVYVDSRILILVSGLSEEGSGSVEMPYLYTMNPDVRTNCYVKMDMYNTITGSYQTTLGDLSTLVIPKGYFAGLMISVGASYSWMETDGEMAIDAPLEGAVKEFEVKAFRAPDRWSLTEDGVTKADWATIEDIEPSAEADTYKVKISVAPNTDPEPRDTKLYLSSPGSRLPIMVTQPGASSGIGAVNDGQGVSVKVVGTTIEITGGKNIARIYSVGGAMVASAALDGGKTVIDAANLAKGVYLIRIDDTVTSKIVL